MGDTISRMANERLVSDEKRVEDIQIQFGCSSVTLTHRTMINPQEKSESVLEFLLVRSAQNIVAVEDPKFMDKQHNDCVTKDIINECSLDQDNGRFQSKFQNSSQTSKMTDDKISNLQKIRQKHKRQKLLEGNLFDQNIGPKVLDMDKQTSDRCFEDVKVVNPKSNVQSSFSDFKAKDYIYDDSSDQIEIAPKKSQLQESSAFGNEDNKRISYRVNEKNLVRDPIVPTVSKNNTQELVENPRVERLSNRRYKKLMPIGHFNDHPSPMTSPKIEIPQLTRPTDDRLTDATARKDSSNHSEAHRDDNTFEEEEVRNIVNKSKEKLSAIKSKLRALTDEIAEQPFCFPPKEKSLSIYESTTPDNLDAQLSNALNEKSMNESLTLLAPEITETGAQKLISFFKRKDISINRISSLSSKNIAESSKHILLDSFHSFEVALERLRDEYYDHTTQQIIHEFWNFNKRELSQTLSEIKPLTGTPFVPNKLGKFSPIELLSLKKQLIFSARLVPSLRKKLTAASSFNKIDKSQLSAFSFTNLKEIVLQSYRGSPNQLDRYLASSRAFEELEFLQRTKLVLEADYRRIMIAGLSFASEVGYCNLIRHRRQKHRHK